MEKLPKRWSPREIVRRLAAEYPDDRTMRISHEAIYRYIYVLPRGSLKTTLVKALRQARAYRRKQKSRNHQETRGKIVEMLSIEERPHDVADRAIPGHWEGDLIMGKHQRTALGTLVERTTRYTRGEDTIRNLKHAKRRRRIHVLGFGVAGIDLGRG